MCFCSLFSGIVVSEVIIFAIDQDPRRVPVSSFENTVITTLAVRSSLVSLAFRHFLRISITNQSRVDQSGFDAKSKYRPCAVIFNLDVNFNDPIR